MIYSSNRKKKTLLYTIMLTSFFLAISLSIIPYYQQNIEAQETDTTNKEKDNCITYNNF